MADDYQAAIQTAILRGDLIVTRMVMGDELNLQGLAPGEVAAAMPASGGWLIYGPRNRKGAS